MIYSSKPCTLEFFFRLFLACKPIFETVELFDFNCKFNDRVSNTFQIFQCPLKLRRIYRNVCTSIHVNRKRYHQSHSSIFTIYLCITIDNI
jgi:hypothetical protein